MDYTQFALAAVGPMLTAGLAAVAMVVRDRVDSRRRREDQTYRLERIGQQVGSVSAWLDAHGKVSDLDPDAEQNRAQLAAELRRLHAGLLSELRTPPVHSRPPGSAVRDLMLIGVNRGGAMVARVLFYVALPWAFVMLALSVPSVVASGVGFGPAFVAALLIALVYVSPVAGLWWLARTLHRRVERRGRGATGSDRPGGG